MTVWEKAGIIAAMVIGVLHALLAGPIQRRKAVATMNHEHAAAIEALGAYAYDGAVWTSVPTMVKSALIKAGASQHAADTVAATIRRS
jgi:hypothetical protein